MSKRKQTVFTAPPEPSERKVTLAGLARDVEQNDAEFMLARRRNKAIRETIADQVEELAKMDAHASRTMTGKRKPGRKGA